MYFNDDRDEYNIHLYRILNVMPKNVTPAAK